MAGREYFGVFGVLSDVHESLDITPSGENEESALEERPALKLQSSTIQRQFEDNSMIRPFVYYYLRYIVDKILTISLNVYARCSIRQNPRFYSSENVPLWFRCRTKLVHKHKS